MQNNIEAVGEDVGDSYQPSAIRSFGFLQQLLIADCNANG